MARRESDEGWVYLEFRLVQAQKKPLTAVAIRGLKFRQRATLPRANPAVPSPMRLFTSVFGMETGVASSLWPPEKQSNVSGWTHRIERCFKLQYEVITASLWAISIGQLNVSQRLHLQPIKVVVFNLPSPQSGGNLVFGEAWRLDAFSAYPFRT